MRNAYDCKPLIGYLDVADPRLGPKMFRDILKDSARNIAWLKAAGIRVKAAGIVVDTEPRARQAVEQMRRAGVCGILIRTAWFHRSNVTAGIAQQAGVPCCLWAVPSRQDASLIGLGVAHGALDEIGANHQLFYGGLEDGTRASLQQWARACAARADFQGAVYGAIGGRCLEMLPMSSDENQLRRMFGMHIDPVEQWTLIHRAQAVPAARVRPLVKKWRASFKSIACAPRALERSARLYAAGTDLFEERGWSFAGIQCQPDLIDNYLAPCLPIALWNDAGFIVACENDINNALGMFLLGRLAGRPAMFGDVQYIYRERNLVRILNCGMAAPSLAGGTRQVELHDCPVVQGTWDEQRKKYLCQGGACTHFVLPAGPVTVARFGRIKGRYVIHLARGMAVDEPHDRSDMGGIAGVWPWAYIRLASPWQDFVRNMRAHHCCVAPADCAAGVLEFARLFDMEVLS